MKKVLLLILSLLMLVPLRVKGIYATSAIVMDMDSKRILYSSNIHNIRSVASISKVMTAILAIKSGKIDDEVTMGEEILTSYGSGIYIKVGEKMTLKDLVYGLMLRSGNDAALAIAQYVGGSIENFVNMMNNKAKELGMKNTTFHNPHGLESPKGNYSTAYDMAILTSYAMQDKLYQTIVGTKHHTVKTNYNYYDWDNKNKLLTMYEYATGGKTGYTEIAKRTLITTATKNKLNLVVVTLNDGNDFNDHISLHEEAFANYTKYTILKKGIINIVNENYYKDGYLYLKEQYSYPLLENEKNSIILKFDLKKKTKYKTGDQVGTVRVFIGDNELYETGVYIKLKKEISWWEKFKLWFDHLW